MKLIVFVCFGVSALIEAWSLVGVYVRAARPQSVSVNQLVAEFLSHPRQLFWFSIFGVIGYMGIFRMLFAGAIAWWKWGIILLGSVVLLLPLVFFIAWVMYQLHFIFR